MIVGGRVVVVGGFERDEVEERWVCYRQKFAMNGNVKGVGHLLLVSLAM